MYFVVKVTSGQEKVAVSMLQNKATKTDLPIYSIVLVEGMKGYVIIEVEDEVSCRQFITRERNIKGILGKPLSAEEINKLIEVKSYVPEIEKDDVVEFINGDLRGYKAKVIKVDERKDEITVEIMDAVVRIPITVKTSVARVIEKAHQK